MKKNLFLATLMLFSFCLSLTSQKSDRDRIGDCIFSKDNAFIENIASKVDPDGWIEFLPIGFFEQGDLFNLYKSELGLSHDDEMVLVRSNSGNYNDDHYRYEQFYKGIPVECGRLIEHFRDCLLVSLNGKFLCDISMDVNPSKSPSEAITTALNDMNGVDYLWNDPAAELELQENTEDPNATYYPNPELLIDCDKNLIYKFKLRTLSSTQEYRIDANTGAIISKFDPKVNCFHSESNDVKHDCSDHKIDSSEKSANENMIVGPIQTTGSTLFSGQQPMPTHFHYNIFTGGKHQLKWDFNKNKIETRDHQLSTNDNDWRRKVEYSGSSGAPFTWPVAELLHTQTHWAVMNSWDYFRVVHGASIHRDNGTIKVKSNSGTFGAFYSNDIENPYLNIGSIPQLGGYLGTMDVVGHELTHWAVHERSDLGQNATINNSEQRSLNESFADIFGTLIEMEYRPGGGDWLMNSEQVTLRNVLDPSLSPTIPGIQSGPQPEVYMDANWNSASGAAPHTNGGVQNKWFSLLANGGAHNGQWVDGIGIDKAAQITWHNLDNYIEMNSMYIDARNGAVQSAIDIFGACSFEHNQTMIAWEACGRGTKTSCFTQEGEALICTNLQNLPLIITINSEASSPLTWTPRDFSLGPFTWGTSDWTYFTMGAQNNILWITGFPDPINTTPYDLTQLPFIFEYQDQLGNYGSVFIRFVDCPTVNGPNPETEKNFSYCDWVQTRFDNTDNHEKAKKIVISPNPVQNELKIDGISKEDKYRIINISGREISKGKISDNQTISVTNLPNGIYILQIINDTTKELRYGKFIKAN